MLSNAFEHGYRYSEDIDRQSSSFLSFHQELYVRQIVPSQCLAQPMAMPLAVARSWGEQAVSIMGQTSRCCMVCLMPQSHVSCSLENPHFSIFTLDRPTCERNRLRAFQVVQGFSAPAGRCSSGLMLRCTLASRGSSRSLHSSMRAALNKVKIFQCSECTYSLVQNTDLRWNRKYIGAS